MPLTSRRKLRCTLLVAALSLALLTGTSAEAACAAAPGAATNGALRFVGTANTWTTITNLGTPAAGDIVYDTTNNALSVCNGTTWTTLGGSGLPALTSAKIWVGNGSNAATAVTMSGDATLANTGAITIANSAVTNAKMANMAATTIKGNNTAGSAAPLDLTATQVTAMLNNMLGDSGSGGTKGLVPAPASGDAAAGKYLKADGTWATVSAGGTNCTSQSKTMYYEKHIAISDVSDMYGNCSKTHSVDKMNSTSLTCAAASHGQVVLCNSGTVYAPAQCWNGSLVQSGMGWDSNTSGWNWDACSSGDGP
jgi:hypothetical protein